MAADDKQLMFKYNLCVRIRRVRSDGVYTLYVDYTDISKT